MGLFTEMAVKEKLKARIALCGPTGSGKTWTAAQFAVVLAGGPMSQGGAPIGFVDTENRSAAYYAAAPGTVVDRLQPWDPPYEFYHHKVRKPYDPRELVRLIEVAEEDLGTEGVLIVDSLTHYWTGEGGTLDIVDDAKQRGGGSSFNGWQEGTPAQRNLLDTIIHAPFHVIVTMRSKMEYVLEEYVDRGGQKRSKPVKIGMAPEQRAGVEYEFTIVGDMDLEHRLIVSKSRCDAVADMVAPKGRSIDVIQPFAEWLGTGVARISPDEVADLTGLFNEPRLSADDRKAVKLAFVETFGQPAEMLTDKLEEATLWIIAKIDRIVGPQQTSLDKLDEAMQQPTAEPVPSEPEPADEEGPPPQGAIDSLEFPDATDIAAGEPAPDPVPGAEYGDVETPPPATTTRRRAGSTTK